MTHMIVLNEVDILKLIIKEFGVAPNKVNFCWNDSKVEVDLGKYDFNKEESNGESKRK